MQLTPHLTNPCTIYLVRHGETEWNVRRLLQGQHDSPLTKSGQHQAKELTNRLGHISFDAIFSSDLNRAMRTAAIMAQERKMAVTASHLLRERGYGEFEGKHIDQFRAELRNEIAVFENLTEHAEKMQFKYADDIESDHELFTRLSPYLREVSLAYAGKQVLMVSHGGMMKAFLLAMGWGSYEELRHNAIQNTAYIVVVCDGSDFFIQETWGVIKNAEAPRAVSEKA